MKQFILLAIAVLNVTALSFAQQRYGALDSSFGTDGKVVSTNFGTCNAVAVQQDQKIIAAGIGILGEDSGFVLARYLAEGTLDSSFGTEGRVVTELASYPTPY